MKYTPSGSILRMRVLMGVGALLAAFLGWAATDHAAQDREPGKQPPKQRVEEEEDVPAKPPKRKIRFEEEDTKGKPTRPGINPSGDFNQLAREAKKPEVQKLYQALAVPHDLLTPLERDKLLPPKPVAPLEKYYGNDVVKLRGPIQIVPLNEEMKAGNAMVINGAAVKSIEPYELVALKKLDDLRKTGKVNVYEELLVEEQVLSAVMRFHGSAKESGLRKGDEWTDIERQLRVRLVDVLLKQLTELMNVKDWDSAFTLASRIADSFPAESDQQRIAPRILDLLKNAMEANKTPTINANQLRDIHLRLHALTEQFPNNLQIQKLKQELRVQAEALVKQAEDLETSTDPKKLEYAQELLRQAEEMWPTLEGFDKRRNTIRQKNPILKVGVRQLPLKMSPNAALTDSELRAVEMIFESLVKFSPDAFGRGRYQAALAEGRPQVVELGRQFQLPTNALWSDKGKLWSDTDKVEITDIRATFRALQMGEGPDHSLAWENLYGDKVVTGGGDGLRVTVNLGKGYIEPLAMMNAKIVPARGLHRNQADAFAVNPVGSGPFAYAGMDSENGRPYAKFVSNTYYGTRASKLGLPHFREVRFFVYTDALQELQNPKTTKLMVLLDLTAEEAEKIGKDSASNRFNVALPAPKAAPNHRVYYLAINHRKRPLDDPKVRGAITAAINREKLLDANFRGPLKGKIHKSLNSLYPANSWACDPKLVSHADPKSCDPFDPLVAMGMWKEAQKNLARNEVTLTLKYPEGDKALADAMTALAEQVQELLKLRIEPKAVDARKLKEDLDTTDFDLAYCHYDFPDDTFWLGPLFAGKKLRQGDQNPENVFGFEDKELNSLLQQSIDFREFTKVQGLTQTIHRLLMSKTPVIPLWQLDPLHAIHRDVKTTPFDPQRVFTDVEKWRLE